MESNEIRALRCMAWERAKGELESMGHTYWEHDGRWDRFNDAMQDFIKHVEDEGLQE